MVAKITALHLPAPQPVPSCCSSCFKTTLTRNRANHELFGHWSKSGKVFIYVKPLTWQIMSTRFSMYTCYMDQNDNVNCQISKWRVDFMATTGETIIPWHMILIFLKKLFVIRIANSTSFIYLLNLTCIYYHWLSDEIIMRYCWWQLHIDDEPSLCYHFSL